MPITTNYTWTRKVSPFFLSTSGIVGNPENPAVVTESDGDVVVVWNNNPGSDSNISATTVKPAGTTLGENMSVNTTTSGNQFDPVVTELNDTTLVVAFTDHSSGTDVVRIRFAPPVGAAPADFRVGTSNGVPENDPSLAALSNGKYVVTWTRTFLNNDKDVEFGIYDPTGGASPIFDHVDATANLPRMNPRSRD